MDLVLTEEEREQVKKGESVQVFLEVADIPHTVTAEEKVFIDNTPPYATDVLYMDISLLKQIGSEEAEAVSNPKGSVSIPFPCLPNCVEKPTLWCRGAAEQTLQFR